MEKIIAITNQKGGVGKTTTTLNFGIGLANAGYKVLLIDMDPQGSLTVSLGYQEPDNMEVTLANVLAREINDYDFDASYGVIHHEEGVDFIPGNIELSALDMQLVNIMSRETILKQYLSHFTDIYDYILIDCMPSLGMLTINAFCASDSILIPVQAAYLPTKGLIQLLKTVQKIKRGLNPDLAIEGLLFTMVDERTNFTKAIEGAITVQFGNNIRIFNTRIPFSVRAAEATAEGKSIYAYAKKNPVAISYDAFTQEFLQNEIIDIGDETDERH